MEVLVVGHVSSDWIMIRNIVDNKNSKTILNMPVEEFLKALMPNHEVFVRRKETDGETV